MQNANSLHNLQCGRRCEACSNGLHHFLTLIHRNNYKYKVTEFEINLKLNKAMKTILYKRQAHDHSKIFVNEKKTVYSIYKIDRLV